LIHDENKELLIVVIGMHPAHKDCGNYSKGQVERRNKLATEKPRFKPGFFSE